MARLAVRGAFCVRFVCTDVLLDTGMGYDNDGSCQSEPAAMESRPFFCFCWFHGQKKWSCPQQDCMHKLSAPIYVLQIP